jgi:hypothetical protein
VIDDFGPDVSLAPAVSARGAHVVPDVFGEDSSGLNPPGTDLNQIRVTLFTGLRGRRLDEVARGDTLAAIARTQGQNTRVSDTFEADRDSVMDPNRAFPGQVLRVALRGLDRRLDGVRATPAVCRRCGWTARTWPPHGRSDR